MNTSEKLNAPQRIEPDLYYTVKQAATALQCSVDKLNVRRMRGEPPRFSKFGGQVRYKGADLIASLEACQVDSTSAVI